MRKTTRDHATIRAWAEARGAQPARVRGSAVLRLAFEALPPHWEPLSWEGFFEQLDASGLSLMYEDRPGSRVCKLTRGLESRVIGRAR